MGTPWRRTSRSLSAERHEAPKIACVVTERHKKQWGQSRVQEDGTLMYSVAHFDLLTKSCYLKRGRTEWNGKKRIRNVKYNSLKQVVKTQESNCFDVLNPASEWQGKWRPFQRDPLWSCQRWRKFCSNTCFQSLWILKDSVIFFPRCNDFEMLQYTKDSFSVLFQFAASPQLSQRTCIILNICGSWVCRHHACWNWEIALL